VPISQLIRDGYLCPVTCYAPQRLAARTGGKRRLAGRPVENWLNLARGRPTVLFAPTVAASKAVRDGFLAQGIAAEHIDAHTPDQERDAVIARVETGTTQVLCNCNVLVEGVDIPCLSCCVLLRLAHSYVLFIQAVGRIMRAFPGKRDAILIDHSDAVLEHGFPDEDVRWDLSESDTVEGRNRQDKKEGKRKTPVVCPACGFIYSGRPDCPACGHKLPARLQPVALRRQLLTEVDRSLAPLEQRAARERYWRTCLYTMARTGRTLGAASQMYRRRYHEWPPADFPHSPHRSQCWRKVADVLPQLVGGSGN
jgi:superfamily II DNA or RNA helicase